MCSKFGADSIARSYGYGTSLFNSSTKRNSMRHAFPNNFLIVAAARKART